MPASPHLHDPSSQEYKKARRLHLKATRHKNHDPNWTPFRAVEKKYKARFPPPDLCQVLDLATLNPARTNEVQDGIWSGRSDAEKYREITFAGQAGKAYIIPRIPGVTALALHLSLLRIFINVLIRSCYTTSFSLV